MDVIFDLIDDLFLNGEFEIVDDALPLIDLEKLTTADLVGVMSITLAAKRILKNRSKLIDDIKALLQEREPERWQALTKGF